MSLTTLSWLFTGCALVHNAEEALYLPAWSIHAGRWYRPITPRNFRIAVSLFSTMLLLLTAWAAVSTARSFVAYLFAGYALAMAINAILPHTLVTIVMRRYMPGTTTALALNLPLGVVYLRIALMQHHIALATFAWAGPLTVLALLASLPLFFALSRRL